MIYTSSFLDDISMRIYHRSLSAKVSFGFAPPTSSSSSASSTVEAPSNICTGRALDSSLHAPLSWLHT